MIGRKKDEIELGYILNPKEEYISITHRCIRFSESPWFVSTNLDSLLKTPNDEKHKMINNLKEEIVGDHTLLTIVIERETLSCTVR